MLNTEFGGKITSVSAGIKTRKDEDGTKMKYGIYKVKLVTDDIDYDSITEFNTAIGATLLHIQPAPFKTVNFGDQSKFGMILNLSKEPDEMDEVEVQTSTFNNVSIKNLTVAVKSDIPIYTFDLEIPMISEAKFLFANLKSDIRFEFQKK